MRLYQLSTLLSIPVLLLASCTSHKHAHTSRLPGVWQEQPITIDGSNKDWPSPYPEYDEKAQLGYAVSNDRENLYISVETGDQATQLKILKNGLTVWIDKAGGKDEVTAINYPIPSTFTKKGDPSSKEDQGMKLPQGQGGDNVQRLRLAMSERIKKLIDDAREYSLEGFRACNFQFPILERDSCGIMVRINIDEDNELVWEAVVPLKSFYPKGQVDKRDAGHAMSICFETTGLPRPAGERGSGSGNRAGGGGFRPSVGMGGGMGMRMGGGMHSGGNRGGSATAKDNSMEPMYKSTKTWKHFGLAFKE